MVSKVIIFSDEHFETNKRAPLSSLMVVTLLAACAKQKRHIPFGPGDTKGSFIPLITRGLIIRKAVTTNDHTELLWQVTPEAITLLKDMGIDVPN